MLICIIYKCRNVTFLGSAAHKLMIETKRSTFNYHLPNTVVNKGSANVALIKQSLLREQGKPKKGRLDQPEYRVRNL